MAKSTFSGPVRSLAGFISAGNANAVSLTADTTLTVDAHAGKILLCNDADGKFTLPSIVSTAPGRDDDPNQTNNLGATFTFVVETAATDLYEFLKNQNIEVLLDDRKIRPGIQFADAELIGIPIRIVISEKGIKNNQIEFRSRISQDSEMLSREEVIKRIMS